LNEIRAKRFTDFGTFADVRRTNAAREEEGDHDRRERKRHENEDADFDEAQSDRHGPNLAVTDAMVETTGLRTSTATRPPDQEETAISRRGEDNG
jgi:hypothetical protein